jgi:hypothetical protein
MTMADSPAADRERLLAALTELVEALDRRKPSVGSAAEARVTQEAAALKGDAKTRIRELEGGR